MPLFNFIKMTSGLCHHRTKLIHVTNQRVLYDIFSNFCSQKSQVQCDSSGRTETGEFLRKSPCPYEKEWEEIFSKLR